MWQWTGPAGDYVRVGNYYIHQVNMMRHLLGEDYEVTYTENTDVVFAVDSIPAAFGLVSTTGPAA